MMRCGEYDRNLRSAEEYQPQEDPEETGLAGVALLIAGVAWLFWKVLRS